MRINSLRQQLGFSLVELIAVIVIMGVLAGTVGPRFMSNNTFSVQAARDQVIAALFTAQQKAMAQIYPVRFLCSSNRIDLRLDANLDGTFGVSESITANGLSFPLDLEGAITLGSTQLDFNKLGHTSATSINITKAEVQASVTVSATGYAY